MSLYSRSSHSTTSSFFFKSHDHHRDLHSFPTRRSSDLSGCESRRDRNHPKNEAPDARNAEADRGPRSASDRKSTRLNSSHEWISYAVFCLKKKEKSHAADWRTTGVRQ